MIVNESVNDDYLYHGTSVSNAISILKSNVLIGNDPDRDKNESPSISFSRSKYVSYGYIILILSRSKLSSNYKIVPINVFDDPDDRSLSEERVVGKSISNLHKYLVKIDLSYDKHKINIFNKKIRKGTDKKFMSDVKLLYDTCKKYNIVIGDRLLSSIRTMLDN